MDEELFLFEKIGSELLGFVLFKGVFGNLSMNSFDNSVDNNIVSSEEKDIVDILLLFGLINYFDVMYYLKFYFSYLGE